MSAATAVRPSGVPGAGRRRALATTRSAGRGLTLEQLLDSVWEGLRADGAAQCPVCAERMLRAKDRGRGVCRGCGATLE